MMVILQKKVHRLDKCVGVLCGDYEGVVGMMYSFR